MKPETKESNQPPKLPFIKRYKLVLMIICLIIIGLVVGLRYFVPPKNEATKDDNNNNNTEMLTYNNSRFGFSISYPANWQIGQAPANDDGRSITSPDKLVVCQAFGFNNSLTNDSGQPMTLDQYIEWSINMERQAVSENKVNIVDKSQIKLGDKTATRLVLDNNGEISDSVYTLDNKTGFGFSCNYDNLDQRQKYNDSFVLMYKSFTIK